MTQPSFSLDTAAMPWRDSPCPGVSWKKLLYDESTGHCAVMLRFEPGARYDAHVHPEGEQYLVLEGTLDDGGRTWGPGSFVWHPPKSMHAPSSNDGCLIFVTLPKPIQMVEGQQNG